VKYILLVYADIDRYNQLPEDEQRAVYGEYMALVDAPGMVGSERLYDAGTATTVRVENGSAVTTDGPFVETKEALGGYYLFEADDLEAAVAMAARIPAARMGGAIEVRPVVER
jgi:hypothetical protein